MIEFFLEIFLRLSVFDLQRAIVHHKVTSGVAVVNVINPMKNVMVPQTVTTVQMSPVAVSCLLCVDQENLTIWEL